MMIYLVVGANGGIGSELCLRLAKPGVHVVAASRNSERLSALAAKTSVQPFPLDATAGGQIDGCIDKIIDQHGRLDGVAHCVGSLVLKPAHLTSDEEWAATIDTNLTSAFLIVRSASRAMMKKVGGSIVLISSAAARVGLANHEAIAAAKGGIIGLTLAAAATYGSHNLRVNAIAPGLVRTPLTARLTKSDASLKASTAMHALGRIGEPADVAGAIEWLLQPQQSWITGQVISVDGGLSTVRPRASA